MTNYKYSIDKLLAAKGLVVITTDEYFQLKRKRIQTLIASVYNRRWALQIIVDQCHDTQWASRKIAHCNRALERLERISQAYEPRKCE